MKMIKADFTDLLNGSVGYILPSTVKALLGLFCYSNCIQLCPHITLNSYY